MSCHEWEEALNAAQDGEGALPDAHLAVCADCRRTQELLAAQDRELDAAFAPVRAAEPALVERVSAAVRAERPRRRWILAVAAAAALMLIVTLARRVPPPVLVPDARMMVAALRQATGPVEVLRNDSWVALLSDQGIQAGQAVRSGVGAKAEVSCFDGTRLRLNADTELVVEAPGRVTLRRGEVFASVPGDAEFTTKDCQAWVRKGAFNLWHRDLNDGRRFSKVIAIDGDVKVREQVVEPLMSCIATQGSLSAPIPEDALLRTAWIHDLLKAGPDPLNEIPSRIVRFVRVMGQSKMSHFYEREVSGFGERGVPTLLGILRNASREFTAGDRRNAARLLSEVAGKSAVPDLVELTQDPDPQVGDWSMQALGRITGGKLKTGRDWNSWLQEHPEWGSLIPRK